MLIIRSANSFFRTDKFSQVVENLSPQMGESFTPAFSGTCSFNGIAVYPYDSLYQPDRSVFLCLKKLGWNNHYLGVLVYPQ